MSHFSRLPLQCNCGVADCNFPDPDPSTDPDFPGDVQFGTVDNVVWSQQSRTFPGYDGDADEWVDTDDLAGDEPTWEDLEEYRAMTEGEPSAADLALAVAEVRREDGQYNGWLDILSEGTPEEVETWYRKNVSEF